MKKPLVVLLVAALVVPSVISLAATNEANIAPGEPAQPDGTAYEIKQMTFAQAKLYLNQFDEPLFQEMIQQLEGYSIADNQLTYIIIGGGDIDQIPLNSDITLNTTSNLMENALMLYNATGGLIGAWATNGTGYGFPPGLHVVQRNETKIFVWCYPEDQSAQTFIITAAFPVPIVFKGPHAGGVLARFPSIFRAPLLEDAPGPVKGCGFFIFGLCIPLTGGSIETLPM